MDDRTLTNIAIQQGWTDDTLLFLAMTFLEQQNLTNSFFDYLEQVQKEENEEE